MKKIAEKLRTQAAAMQAIAECDGLKGEYADKLGENARGSAGGWTSPKTATAR